MGIFSVVDVAELQVFSAIALFVLETELLKIQY